MITNEELQVKAGKLLSSMYEECRLIRSGHEYRTKMLDEIVNLIKEMSDYECLQLLYCDKGELLGWLNSEIIVDNSQRTFDKVFEKTEYVEKLYHNSLNVSEKVDIDKLRVYAIECQDITICDEYDWTLREFFEERDFEYTVDYVIVEGGEKISFNKLGDLTAFIHNYSPKYVIEHEIMEDEDHELFEEEEIKTGYWEQEYHWLFKLEL